MAKKQQEYGNDSIRQLKGADRVRKRPAVIFGSDGVEGCAHSIFEIISNSIDEARDGHGNRINVTLFPDHVVEVEDFGRGIPVDYNKAEERWNWDLVFCELYAGGKYAEGSGNYDFSLGLNGLGLCATQYASEWMTADIYRDGFHYHLDFKKGGNVGGLQKEPFKGKRTGSVIRWKPDTEVFTDIAVPAESFKDMLRRQAVVNDGVTLVFTDKSGSDVEKFEYLYEHGITDYANELVGDKALTPVHFCSGAAAGRDRADQPDYQVKMNVAFAFSNTVQCLEYYHNSSWLEHGGSPDRAVRTAFVSQINAWLKNKGLYKKNESAITFADVQDCLVLVSSSFSTRTSYENQTKKAITNKFVAQAMTEFLKHQLEVYFIEHPDEAEKACKQVLINKQSREHAEKARITIKKTMTQQMDLANRVQKFVDCRTKDASRRELYIVEGDSAMGAVKQSRDSEFQAIMPIRGKILNVEKATIDKVLANAEIKTMINAFGCGFSEGYGNDFDISKLRYDKIIIMADADVDGAHISTLLLTLFYRFMPELIYEGHVYVAMPPLYKVIPGKGEEEYLYDDAALEKYRKAHKGSNFTLQRYKGLGEMDAEQLWETTLNPATRMLKRIEIEDGRMASDITELLMGNDVPPRKTFIYEHAHDAELDV